MVWFLNGTHPRLRFPRQRNLAFLDPRRRATYSSQTSCTVCAGIPISLPAPAVECCKVALPGQRWLCLRACRWAPLQWFQTRLTALAAALRCFPDVLSLTRYFSVLRMVVLTSAGMNGHLVE